MIISLLLVALAGAAVIDLCRRSESPVAVKLVAVESAGRSNLKSVIVEFTRRGSNWECFAEGPKVQARVANRWLEPQPFPELADAVLLGGTNRENVRFLLPREAVACRFLLQYRTGPSPYCQGYGFLSRLGLLHRFPKLCQWALKPLRGRLPWKHATTELGLPAAP